LLLQKPNPSGNVVFKVRNSGSPCAGEVAQQTILDNSSNRVVLFMGQDMSGDGQPDLMMLNTHTMQWRFYFSQSHPGLWNSQNISWGNMRDVPL
jgi:hypothetical protein